MTRIVQRVAGTYAVARLAPTVGWPWWATRSTAFASVTRTVAETSVVCEASLVPAGERAERDFSLWMVQGPIPFDAVGVLASIVQPLAAASISIFSVSTFDTDYLLVPCAEVDRAIAAWRAAGHDVHDAPTVIPDKRTE
ncbi:MAG: ACT domain-containing protein [Cytophagaceae bacterium]|nr:ACT domain-containing protein [Gemmatimonadaceae bacterium]